VFAGLRVDTARMTAEVDRSAGGSMTENLVLALTARGLARADAHELLRRLTQDLGKGPPLAERARADPAVRKWFEAAEIDRLLDPASYVRAAAEKTDRILTRVEGELSE
jgi:adenylosuccinate lyase